MYKEDSALTNLKWLICHQTKPYIMSLNLIIQHTYLFIQKIYPIKPMSLLFY